MISKEAMHSLRKFKRRNQKPKLYLILELEKKGLLTQTEEGDLKITECGEDLLGETKNGIKNIVPS